MKQKLIAATLIVSTCLQTVVQAESLKDIYQLALQQDPQLMASEANRKYVEAGVTVARSSLLPSLTASYRTGTGSNSVSDLFDSDNYWNETKSISMSQSIYDHSNWVALSIAEKRSLAADLEHEAKKQALLIRVAEQYFDVLKAKDNFEFSKAETEAVAQELEQTEQRYKAGLIAITDVHEAKARYDEALAAEISATNLLDNARETLRTTTGSYHQNLDSLKEQLPLQSPEPSTIDDWVKVAVESNLALRAQKLQVEIAKKDISGTRDYPTVELSIGHSDSRNFDYTGSGASAELTVSVPLFTGFRTSANVDRAKYEYQRQTHFLEEQYRETVRSARSAYLGILTSISSVKARRQAAISGQSALDATKAGFEAGTRTMVEVLGITRNLFSAKRNLSAARYDYVLNHLRLKQAAGILSDEDVQMVESLLIK